MVQTGELTVLILDDDTANLDGMRGSLERNGMTVYPASTVAQAHEILAAHAIDVAVLDIVVWQERSGDAMIGAGIELARQLRRERPHIGLVFRSAYTHYVTAIQQFIKDGHGGVAYLFKGGDRPGALADAVRLVARGGVQIDPRIAGAAHSLAEAVLRTLSPMEQALVAQVMSRFHALSDREVEVLQNLAWSRRAIAENLVISERTVDRHISSIYDKLGLTQADQPELRQDVVLAKAYLVYQLQGGGVVSRL